MVISPVSQDRVNKPYTDRSKKGKMASVRIQTSSFPCTFPTCCLHCAKCPLRTIRRQVYNFSEYSISLNSEHLFFLMRSMIEGPIILCPSAPPQQAAMLEGSPPQSAMLVGPFIALPPTSSHIGRLLLLLFTHRQPCWNASFFSRQQESC